MLKVYSVLTLVFFSVGVQAGEWTDLLKEPPTVGAFLRWTQADLYFFTAEKELLVINHNPNVFIAAKQPSKYTQLGMASSMHSVHPKMLSSGLVWNYQELDPNENEQALAQGVAATLGYGDELFKKPVLRIIKFKTANFPSGGNWVNNTSGIQTVDLSSILPANNDFTSTRLTADFSDYLRGVIVFTINGKSVKFQKPSGSDWSDFAPENRVGLYSQYGAGRFTGFKAK